MIPLLYLTDSDKKYSSFFIFFNFSFFSHLIILYWIPGVMVYYGGMNVVLGILGLFILSIYISLFYGFSGIIIKQSLKSDLQSIILIPAVWISKDLILEKLFGGFPWQFTGYSQFNNTFFIQISSIGGVHLISFLVILLNVLLFLFLKKRKKKFIISFLILIFSIYLTGFFVYRQDYKTEKILPENSAGIIQPNTGQNFSSHKKWRRVKLEELFNESKILRESGSEFVIWPEYSIGLSPLRNKYTLNKFLEFVHENIPIFAGFTDYKNSEEMYNSIMLFKNKAVEKYDKTQLVPFGEYIPFKKVFSFIEKITNEISDFTPGKSIHNLTLKDKKISTPICYEIIYPEIVRNFIDKGGELIILISNDSWYGTTSAPYQLLSMSVLRAIENRRFILRSTSNGISAVIDPRGNIKRKIPLNVQESFIAKFKFRNNKSFFTRFGYMFPYFSLLFTLIFLIRKIILYFKSKQHTQ